MSGLTLNDSIYVPILKWKRGEQGALSQLSSAAKHHVLPIIEIPPIPYDYEKGEFKKTIDSYLVDIGKALEKANNTNRKFMVDLQLLPDTTIRDGRHVIRYIFDEAAKKNITMVPVISSHDSQSYIDAVKDICDTKKSLCFRMIDDDFGNLKKAITALLQLYRIAESEVDLILDFKYIMASNVNTIVASAEQNIKNIPNIDEWRTLAICATSFPENLSVVKANTVEQIIRAEWAVWNQLRKKSLGRLPAFGDYAIANPKLLEMDPRLMKISANIRYTSTDRWYVHKGASIQKAGFAQIVPMCANLITQPYYSGESFSAGDKTIHDCASPTCVNPGNSETWRRVGTNHHMEFVISQLASHFAP